MRKQFLIPLILSLLQLGAFAPAQAQSAGPATASNYDKLVDEYFDLRFQFHPTEATEAGFHQYDTKLENPSRASMAAEIAVLNQLQAKFGTIQKSSLNEESAADLQILQDAIRASLLDLETIQMWRKDPDEYPSAAANSIFLIMERNFAPQKDRLQSVIAREKQIPQLLETGRQNLSNPPHVYTEVALEQLPGTIDFFRSDVLKAFPEVHDPALLAEFKAANGVVIQSLQKYQTFLKTKLLPASQGDFRIGAQIFSKKLLYDDMVDIPLDHLLEIGYADLRRNQQTLKETAAKIDRQHSPREVLAQLQKDHPPGDQLLQTFRDVLGGLRQFIVQNKIITLPPGPPPMVEDTPAFERSLTTASMETPGAYETKATEAMFNVTAPQPDWKPERTENWMLAFNRGTIVSTAVHEVYPGHYTQFLWIKQAPTKVRKLLYCNTNAEGWAHYTEQMMLDEGYGNGDPKLRMGQLQDALLRDSRFIAGIEMHTGKMTLNQATKFFVEEGYQVPAVAEVEAKRGTSDPTYLYYTLGKLQILKLREDYKKSKGDSFTLEEFHDNFMKQGPVALKIIRQAMLGNDTPTL